MQKCQPFLVVFINYKAYVLKTKNIKNNNDHCTKAGRKNMNK